MDNVLELPVAGLGEKPAVVFDGTPVTEKSIGPLKPLVRVTVTV